MQSCHVVFPTTLIEIGAFTMEKNKTGAVFTQGHTNERTRLEKVMLTNVLSPFPHL